MLSVQQFGQAAVSRPVDWLLRGQGSLDSGDAIRLRSSISDRRRSERKPFRVANFVGLSGSTGIWGPASTNSALLAVSEINRRGGILGREIELTFHDAGGCIDGIVRAATDIVVRDDADLIMGSHISAVRVALRNVVSGRIPYIYTPVYEGGERTPGVMAIGETPRDQTRPAIEWLTTAKRASRWYLIGSDYVWPWLSHKSTKKYIAAAGGRVVGEEFVAMGEHDHSAAIARIRAAKPDVVMISLIGTDSVVFNRAFGECGLGSQMLRLCGAMDETLLLGIGCDNTENLFCASGYFMGLASRASDIFQSDYQSSFGCHAPPVGSVAQSNYEGLRFLEAIATRAGCLSGEPLVAAARNGAYHGARGIVAIKQGGAKMPIYLAEADGLDFRMIRNF